MSPRTHPGRRATTQAPFTEQPDKGNCPYVLNDADFEKARTIVTSPQVAGATVSERLLEVRKAHAAMLARKAS